jgi:hypothetical protein
MEKNTMEVIGELAQEPAGEAAGQEIRSLKDLELVLVGGGSDGAVCW